MPKNLQTALRKLKSSSGEAPSAAGFSFAQVHGQSIYIAVFPVHVFGFVFLQREKYVFAALYKNNFFKLFKKDLASLFD